MKTILLILLLPLYVFCQDTDTSFVFLNFDTNFVFLKNQEPQHILEYIPADTNGHTFSCWIDSSSIKIVPAASIYINGDTALLLRFLIGYLIQLEEKNQQITAAYREYIDAIDCDNESTAYLLKQARLLRRIQVIEYSKLPILKP